MKIIDYSTIRSDATAEFVERKSRFIGHVRPVKTKLEAEEFIREIKSKHYNATHNVSAYIVQDERIERCSDDGEPQGTAGVPVLDVLQKEGLTDLCVVVTRYFGGTLLGTGGLVRAYSHGCKIAVDAAEIVHISDCERLVLAFDYNLYGKINYILPNYNIKQENAEFSDTVLIELLVQKPFAHNLKNDLIELTNGQVTITLIEDTFSEFC